MRYYTKEYYTLLNALGAAEMYEPVIDKEYSDDEIGELYQKAMDKYIEELRADYDEPPELWFDPEDPDDFDPEEYAQEVEEYENREPFDEDEAREEFEEMYRDNLEDPDEDLPEWVRETVDPRILAMYCMPEKTYRKLSEEDAAVEERFDVLDERADEELEALREAMPDDYGTFWDVLEDQENACVTGAEISGGVIEISLIAWDDEGEEEPRVMKFTGVEIAENEDIRVKTWKDEDGDLESDCELLGSEIYVTDGKPEVHMLFDNNGFKYLTFSCREAEIARAGRKKAICAIRAE